MRAGNRHFGGTTLLAMAALTSLGGCANQMAVLNPMGAVGAQEKTLILAAFWVMLIVVIPVFFMTFWFAWKYRASNKAATYAPKWDYSGKIEAVVWLVPAVIVAALGVLAWKYSHELDPYRPIEPGIKPVNIEVVALDWKWLFIYPDQGIATVNRLVIPAGVPVSLRPTSDSVMNSFFIPQLGSQIYAMAGMQTRLHLLADRPGVYEGLNTQFSGAGFSGQHFEAVATSKLGFDEWIKQIEASPNRLDEAAFHKLEAPSRNNPVTYFSAVKPHLFSEIIGKYLPNGAPPAAGRGVAARIESGNSPPKKTGTT